MTSPGDLVFHESLDNIRLITFAEVEPQDRAHDIRPAVRVSVAPVQVRSSHQARPYLPNPNTIVGAGEESWHQQLFKVDTIKGKVSI